MRFMRVIQRWLNALLDIGEESVPVASGLRSDIRQMFENLNLRADAASFAMALSDQKYTELQTAVAEAEALASEAKTYLRNENKVLAERCMARKLAADERIKKLGGEYQSLQAQAEEHARTFKREHADANRRKAELPQLEQDVQLVQMQEALDRKTSALTLGSAKQSFDEAKHKLAIRRKQIENRGRLMADPEDDLDREIQQGLEKRQLEEAMGALRKEIDSEAGVIDAEFTVVREDAVAEARKMLAAPRFSGILPERTDSKVPVLVKRRPN